MSDLPARLPKLHCGQAMQALQAGAFSVSGGWERGEYSGREKSPPAEKRNQRNDVRQENRTR